MAQRQDAVNLDEATVVRTPAGDALTALILRVVQLTHAFTAKGEALAKPTGQTLARWVVLDAVAAAPVTVAQISRRFGYARQSVQRVADLLVRDGLAAYEDNPRHRRAKLLRPTPRGRRILHAINSDQKDWSDALGARIGEEDLMRMSHVLDRLLAAMRDE
ncbi:MAG: MarR family winged helix-turn-helix transcriptional regulator [Jiangellaceae bacterium]